MRKWKQRLAFFLCLILLVSTTYVPLQAQEKTAIQKMEYKDTITHINPIYADVISESDLESLKSHSTAFVARSTSFADEEEAGAYVREALKNRIGIIEVSVDTMEADYLKVMNDVMNAAFAHTGNGIEGDYLLWQYAGYRCMTSYIVDTAYHYTFTFEMVYYTSAEQEEEVDASINTLLSTWNFEGKSRYEQIKQVYDYICTNITYDYANLGNEDYKLQYTAYAALINKTCVCQGYSVLLYRLLNDLGIDCRLIAGNGNGDAHSWNIIKMGDVYYNVDATWDASYLEMSLAYQCFLKCDAEFDDHARFDDYVTTDFQMRYPMTEVSYNPETHMHDWNEGEISKEADCKEEGERIYTCKTCGEIRQESIAKDETLHKWNEGEISKEANCKEEGERTYTCEVCGKIRLEKIAKDETLHKWNKGEISKKANCKEEGERTYTCKTCGKIRLEKIAKDKRIHNWSAWKRVSQATALAKEKQKRSCSCGKEEYREVGKTLPKKATLTTSSLKMRISQKTTKFKVSGFSKGDYVKSWKSTKENIVQVVGKKNGTCTLQAKKKTGKAQIIITMASGLQKKLNVTVQKGKVTTTAIKGLKNSVTLKKGHKVTLKPELAPITSQDTVKYTTSDKKIVSVTQKGVVKGIKVGTAKITVKAGSKKFVVKIKVKK